MFLNIAMQMKEQFYKLVALGLGTVYAFQVFLTIGGVTKFIPSTGVTLPLVSYGGSSLLATMMLFAVIQGLYILRQDEGENNARKKQRKTAPSTKSAHALAVRESIISSTRKMAPVHLDISVSRRQSRCRTNLQHILHHSEMKSGNHKIYSRVCYLPKCHNIHLLNI